MKILQQLCSVPTAPFAEQHVIRYVERFVRERRRLKLSRDRYGNLLIELPAGRRNAPRTVFSAHMDHPGFVASRMLDRRTLEASFYGWVMPEYFEGERVRFFGDGGEAARATVLDFTLGEDRKVPRTVRLRASKPIANGSPGMWDQGEGRVKGKKFYSRVCDDLAGAAAALTMLDQLARKPPKGPMAVLLTRAEEEGVLGGVGAA